jgi:pimeloyl-ACP methyl ester carboxylesterase
VEIPETRYAKTADGVFIAFQVFGRGLYDLLFVPGFFSNVVLNWELPGMARFLERLSTFARVVVIDRRGVGLSDRMSPGDLPALEVQMEDLFTVLDAVRISKAHLVGSEDGAELCALAAASAPERVQSLSAYGLIPRMGQAEGYPFGPTPEEARARVAARAALWERGWGMEAAREDYEYAAPSVATDARQIATWARYLTLSASPGSAIAVLRAGQTRTSEPSCPRSMYQRSSSRGRRRSVTI